MEGTLDTYYVYLMCLFASFVYAVLGMTNYEIILLNIYIFHYVLIYIEQSKNTSGVK